LHFVDLQPADGNRLQMRGEAGRAGRCHEADAGSAGRWNGGRPQTGPNAIFRRQLSLTTSPLASWGSQPLTQTRPLF